MKLKFYDFEQVADNLYRYESRYYRLKADGVTPNGSWMINPAMVELLDIDIATGNFINGASVINFECCGTVQAPKSHI